MWSFSKYLIGLTVLTFSLKEALYGFPLADMHHQHHYSCGFGATTSKTRVTWTQGLPYLTVDLCIVLQGIQYPVPKCIIGVTDDTERGHASHDRLWQMILGCLNIPKF